MKMCIRDSKVPDHVATVEGFIRMSKEEIAQYCQENGFAMTPADLLCTCLLYTSWPC